jgi:hypothetical protein
MIYILAFFLPPVALLLNGQPFSAVFSVLLIVFCFVFGWFLPVLFLVPSIHGIVSVHMRREDRKHRELVDAIERHGPPPWWVR